MSSTCCRRVAEAAQGPRDRLVDDGHVAAADQLLHLDQAEVGLDAGGVAVHHQADGAGGRQDARPAQLRTPYSSPSAHGLVPRLLGGRRAARRGPAPRRCRRPSSRCMSSTRSMCSSLSAKPANGPMRAAVRADGGVGVAGHQRRERAGPGPALVASRRAGPAPSAGRRGWRSRARAGGTCGVVSAIGLGRVVGAADQDLLGGEHDLDRVPCSPRRRTSSSSSRNLSRLRLARLHAELSRCMYSEHGLRAVDAARWCGRCASG